MRNIPQFLIVLLQILHICVIIPPRLMDASGKLVEIVAGAAQECYELPQFRQMPDAPGNQPTAALHIAVLSASYAQRGSNALPYGWFLCDN